MEKTSGLPEPVIVQKTLLNKESNMSKAKVIRIDAGSAEEAVDKVLSLLSDITGEDQKANFENFKRDVGFDPNGGDAILDEVRKTIRSLKKSMEEMAETTSQESSRGVGDPSNAKNRFRILGSDTEFDTYEEALAQAMAKIGPLVQKTGEPLALRIVEVKAYIFGNKDDGHLEVEVEEYD